MKYAQFEAIVDWIYKSVDTAHFSLDDCKDVFKLYFNIYSSFMGTSHPIPSYHQIVDIMEKMPYADSEQTIELYPTAYEAMIPQYFLTAFSKCDRNISHFFSGRIRELRYYETCY